MENLPKNIAMQWRTWCINPAYFFGDISEEDFFFKDISTNVTSKY